MKTVEEPWWQVYRKRQLKKLNMEMVLRKSLFDAAKEYTNHSSLGGVKKIFERDIGIHYRLIWIAIFVGMFANICYFLFHTWFDTFTKPLIVTMESTTYPITDIDFPAIAICNINRISKKALENFAREKYNASMTKHNQTFEEVLSFSRHLGRLLDYSWLEELRRHPLLDFIGSDASNITQQMKMLAPKCEEMLLRCTWSGTLVNCTDIFEMRRTARGHCCAFNFILDYESAGRPNGTIADVKHQKSSGFLNGLNILLDTQVEDYSYPMSNMVGFEIFLFDPTHYADPSGGRVIHRILEANQTMMLELQSVVQTATEEVRKYPLSTRKCLFHDENDKFNKMYSLSACIINCRTRTVQSLCKCTPFFVSAGSDKPTCTLDELSCLNKYKEKLLYIYPQGSESNEGLETEIQDSLFCPECLPDCEFTQHFTRAFKIPNSMRTSSQHEYASKQLLFKFILGIDLIDKCLISIYQTTDFGTLDRLDVISYWFEIVSNIGGFAGIFLGFSFVATVEVFFFLVIRFPRILYENYKEFY